MLKLSYVLNGNGVGRFDASYFFKDDLERLRQLGSIDHETLGSKCYVTDGIHTSIDFQEGSGVRVISAKHPKNGFLDLRLSEEISVKSHEANPRTALRADDVVLSTVGTIGNAAVVREEALPANSDRHVAILRVLKVDRPVSPEFLAAFLNCSFGRMQSQRETTGNVQPNLFLVKVRELKVARFSAEFEKRIYDYSLLALQSRRYAEQSLATAEAKLLNVLSGGDWSPFEPLAYTARAKDVSQSARLDPQYFMPVKGQVRRALAKMPGRPLSQCVESIRDQWLPERAPREMLVRNYDVTDALVPLLDAEKLPSLASEVGSMKKLLNDGDVAMSRLRAYLKEVAVVRTGDDIPSVGSSEFYVLRPIRAEISPETLMVYLRSTPVQSILKWCQDGSQHPRFSESDLLSIPVPDAVGTASPEITLMVQLGFAARYRAKSLYEATTRAIEIAIEEGLSEAERYLDDIGELH